MIILHVSNLRFNRRWFKWLLDHAPRHDLLVIAGNLVDYDLPASIHHQREWVRDWLADYGRPACVASGPEDRVFDPRANVWRPAIWLKDVGPAVSVDEDFAEHHGFGVHCIGYGDAPADRHADIWLAYRDPRVACRGAIHDRHGGCDDLVTVAAATAAPIILTGDTLDRLHWQSMDQATLHLNPGWTPSAAFPNHVLLDPATLVASRVSATAYIPKVDVFRPASQRAIGHEEALLETSPLESTMAIARRHCDERSPRTMRNPHGDSALDAVPQSHTERQTALRKRMLTEIPTVPWIESRTRRRPTRFPAQPVAIRMFA